jgi:dihydrofolate reductase
MRRVVLLMHVSLDGYVAGPNGEMDWIKLDDSLWDYVTAITDTADTVIFGANTYKLMEPYWPTAAEQPDASKHDIDHARWLAGATKLVFSKTLEKTDWQGVEIVHGDSKEALLAHEAQPGKDILIIGSPSLAHSFMQMGLIDELRLNINPVILGAGKSLYAGLHPPINLALTNTQAFESGVVAVTYAKS